MEMEDDMEVGLVQQFSCLGTTDKEVLVAQLQKLVGPQLNTSAAHFFLDMNNWNLQLAIGAYFDLTEDSPPSTQNVSSHQQVNGAVSQAGWGDDESWEPVDNKQDTPANEWCSASRPTNLVTTAYSMSIIQDMSVTEDTIIPPRTKFVKQWKIRNNGNLPWPPGAHLRIISGNRSMVAQEKIFMNPQVQPDEYREVLVECVSPDNPGNYQTCWQMSTPEGFLFGDEIWVICSVGPDMTVDLTQRLQSLSCDNSRVNYPIVQSIQYQHSSPDIGCPTSTSSQVPTPSSATAAACGGSMFPNPPSQDSSTDMS